MKKEVKVYKVNKKFLKNIVIGILIILIIVIIAFPVQKLIRNIYYNSLVEYKFDKYNFSIKIPRAYKDLTGDIDDDDFGLNESAFKTDTDIKVDEKYVPQKPTVIFKAGNTLNGISIAIGVLVTEKTSLTLEEIAKNYQTTIMANYDDRYIIGNLEAEYLTILGSDAIRAKVEMYNDEESNTFLAYLAPLDDKEVTITFYGKTDKINENLNDIEKIISRIK